MAPGSPTRRSSKAFNSFQIAQAQFDKVAEYLGLDSATKDLLRNPLPEFQFAIPVRMDDGMVKIFRGVVVPLPLRDLLPRISQIAEPVLV